MAAPTSSQLPPTCSEPQSMSVGLTGGTLSPSLQLLSSVPVL